MGIQEGGKRAHVNEHDGSGMVYLQGPTPHVPSLKGPSSNSGVSYFEVQVLSSDDSGFLSQPVSVTLGVTTSAPEEWVDEDLDMPGEVPCSWSAGYEGEFVHNDGGGEDAEEETEWFANWVPVKIKANDTIGLLIDTKGTLSFFHNRNLVAEVPTEWERIPVQRKQDLYFLASLTGCDVRFNAAASLPVVILGDAGNSARVWSQSEGMILWQGVVPHIAQGSFFELEFELPNEWPAGPPARSLNDQTLLLPARQELLTLGFTLTPPENWPAEISELLDLPETWTVKILAHASEKMPATKRAVRVSCVFRRSVQTGCWDSPIKWNESVLAETDTVGLLIDDEGGLSFYHNENVIERLPSDNSTGIPSAEKWYFVVQLKGCGVKLNKRPQLPSGWFPWGGGGGRQAERRRAIV